MPFTFSHPAAILPFTYLPKRWISITGLVVGSLSPDFEYFLRMKVYSIYSHTWTGMFWFNLPLTIILAFIFHVVVRDRLIENLPSFLNTRLVIFKGFNWVKYFKQNFFIIIISALLGIATHILWDNFTHEQGQLVQLFNLKNNIAIGVFKIPFYKLLQHFSTLVGGLIIIYALIQLPKHHVSVKQKSILSFWVSIGLVALTIVAIRLLTGLDYKLYGNVITTLITGGFIGLILMATIQTRKYNYSQQKYQ